MAQAANFDDNPTGFLTVQTGGMPADAWNGTSLATAKQLVSALPAAPRSRALRDLQFKVLVSALTPPAPDGSPPPSLFARKVEKLAAMGEGESLNEMVRSAGGYADPAIPGESGRASRIIDTQFAPKASETVLVQSRNLTAEDPAFVLPGAGRRGRIRVRIVRGRRQHESPYTRGNPPRSRRTGIQPS